MNRLLSVGKFHGDDARRAKLIVEALKLVQEARVGDVSGLFRALTMSADAYADATPEVTARLAHLAQVLSLQIAGLGGARVEVWTGEMGQRVRKVSEAYQAAHDAESNFGTVARALDLLNDAFEGATDEEAKELDRVSDMIAGAADAPMFANLLSVFRGGKGEPMGIIEPVEDGDESAPADPKGSAAEPAIMSGESVLIVGARKYRYVADLDAFLRIREG